MLAQALAGEPPAEALYHLHMAADIRKRKDLLTPFPYF
jgi:hypothetical protein